MPRVEPEVDRILNRLRNAIRERGYTQLEVQQVLGWGRNYISQLLTRQKSLRFDQLLRILEVIDVTPKDFWGQVYGFGASYRPGRPRRPAASSLPGARGASTLLAELRRTRRLLDGVVAVLEQKQLITSRELEERIADHRPDPIRER